MTTGSGVTLDSLRESWVFLLLGGNIATRSVPEKPQLVYWELGVANAETLVQTETKQIGYESIEDETGLIKALMAELEQYRFQETTLLTPTRATLQTIRKRVTASDNEQASLRGFTHLSVEDQLDRYFDQTLVDYDVDRDSRSAPRVVETESNRVVSSGNVRALWECWQRVFRLLPAGELAGKEL